MTLSNQGLVAIAPRRQPRVAEATLDDVRQIYELRAALYALASELIVERATPSQLQSLWTCYEALRDAHGASDVDQYFWANVTFRDTEIEISGNAQLKHMLDTLRMRTHQFRHFSLSQPNQTSRSLVKHEILLRAYDDRDAALAVATNRSIVFSALKVIEKSWPTFTRNSER